MISFQGLFWNGILCGAAHVRARAVPFNNHCQGRVFAFLERLDRQQVPGSVHILHLCQWKFSVRRCNRLARLRLQDFHALDLRVPLCSGRNKKMLWTLCVILLVLWALGMATSYTASGLIHILLVVALVVMVIRLFQGRRLLG
jgi:hypothetical protein